MKHIAPVLLLSLLACSAAFAADAPVPTQAPEKAEAVQADQAEAAPVQPAELELGAEPTWMTTEECIADCFACFNECVSLCVPPDYDGHPTFTACKLTCRQDLESCKAGC